MTGKKDYILFDKDTQSFIYNMQTNAVQRMLDFDFCCKRDKPSVAAIIDPGKRDVLKCFFGKKEIFIPVYPDISSAIKSHPEVDILINFASFRSAYETSLEALNTEKLRTGYRQLPPEAAPAPRRPSPGAASPRRAWARAPGAGRRPGAAPTAPTAAAAAPVRRHR